MSVSDTLKNFISGVEAEGEKILAEIEGKIETVVPEVKADAVIVGDKIATDWKALAVEATDFLKTVPQRFNGDAVYDHAQAFIAKVAAGL